MNTLRERSIHSWIASSLNTEEFQVLFLAGDASFRRYARILCQNNTFMLMDAPPEKEDCAPFVQIDQFFDQHGVRVPHIIAQDLEQGFLLLEDFGDVLLSTLLDSSTVNYYYQQSFKQLIQLQSIQGQSHLPAYSREKLLSEMQLLTDWLLPSLSIQLNRAQQDVIDHCFNTLVGSALEQPQVIVHRDFHSRNLMKLKNEEQLGVIDFQDAVIGADTYDLISITRDAYVQWDSKQVYQWFADFYDQLPLTAKQNRDFTLFKKQADFMAMQRHIKILGIFVRLYERDGKENYLKDLPRVMWYVLEESKAYPELASFHQLLLDVVVPKFNEKYGMYQVAAA